MATELLHAIADADREGISPTETGAMTTSAGLCRGHRNPCIEVKLLAERGLLRRVRIVLRKGNRRRPTIKRLKGICAWCGLRLQRYLLGFSDESRSETKACKAKSRDRDRADGQAY